jgi:hypothetical protein
MCLLVTSFDLVIFFKPDQSTVCCIYDRDIKKILPVKEDMNGLRYQALLVTSI